MKDQPLYLKHIRDAIERMGTYTAGGRAGFFLNRMVQDAVIRNSKVIGRAVRNISPEFRKRHPEILWRGITGLRNVLIHEYFGVDREIVWGVVRRRLPTLKPEVEALLRKGRR